MRGDLADVALAGKHFSPHYAKAVERFCTVLHTPVYDKTGGRQVSELLAGEAFMLLDTSGGWAWGYCKHDHYVGYVLAEALAERAQPIAETLPANSVDAARHFVEKPYVWGGRGGAGIDCSGVDPERPGSGFRRHRESVPGRDGRRILVDALVQ